MVETYNIGEVPVSGMSSRTYGDDQEASLAQELSKMEIKPLQETPELDQACDENGVPVNVADYLSYHKVS